MCSLCGMLGAVQHWTDAAGSEGAFAGRMPATRRQERQRRAALANRILGHYRLKLADFEGRSYVLSSRTGRSEIVADLIGMWSAAERLAARPCDPLEPGLIEALEQG
jgi:hypothetical protein